MAQLLIELFSEEIPARMQKRAEEDFARALMDRLSAAGLLPEAVKTFSGPRRITAIVEGLPARTPDVSEERKGPRVGAPENAVQGFLRGAGLTSLDQAQIVEDKKGAFYVARIEKKGRETPALIQEIVPEIIKSFPWPKSMRSGVSDLQWVRPLHNIACVFDGEEVVIAVDGVASKAETRGHRFHAPTTFAIKGFEDYAHKLQRARVMIDREERKAVILGEAKTLCAARNLELVEDLGLLEEVAGLVEWPVPLMGDMDPNFLSLPGEVIRLSMRTHQKYFAVRDPLTGKLAPHFITVANIEAVDGGRAIAAGNARVLSARLNDARFFWDGDRKTPLYTDERREKLKQIVFHQKLGSVWDKAERVKALAVELCAATGADPKRVEEAALRCKMDLVTETVGEFPELQGQVGRQLYALEQGADDSVAAAIEDHYRPLGPNDRVPTDPVAVTLALADKLDTLVGFWAIDEKPTGSSDPYGLRRAALGFVRIVLQNAIRFSQPSPPSGGRGQGEGGESDLRHWILFSLAEELRRRGLSQSWNELRNFNLRDLVFSSISETNLDVQLQRTLAREDVGALLIVAKRDGHLLAFLADRLKVQLRDQGKRHDLVDAVFALGDDDLVRIVARVEALDGFLKTEDGKNLLAGYKRAANILASEEKKGKGLSEVDAAKPVDETLLAEPAEKALQAALAKAAPAAKAAVEKEDFAAAMAALSALRAPVDAFFEAVLVNADDAALRRNRLKLLLDIRDALHAVADFSKIEG